MGCQVQPFFMYMEVAEDISEKLAGGLAESSIVMPIKPDAALKRVEQRFTFATIDWFHLM